MKSGHELCLMFFKQETAYEVRNSNWSSDVCSSDHTARTYNFYLDKPVAEAQLHAIWDLMQFGPTSANSLPARIIWCVSDEAKEKLAALAIPGNEETIRAAPLPAILEMDTEFYEHMPEFFPHTDARSCFAGHTTHDKKTATTNPSFKGAH